MKNKKGFTLIELLVTIVIMISVLGLAIVSVNKISESRKKAAYDSVKDQIITAAKEYFDNNEYFIKDLVLTESQTGFVSLGTLVNLDYINSVTNPQNNTKIDMCSFVKVTADNKYEFVDDPTEINAIREEYIDCVMGEPSEIELTQHVEPIVVNTTSFKINVYKKNIGNCSNDGNPILNFGYNKDEGVINQSTKWFNNSDAPNGLFLEIIDDNLDDNLEYVFKDSGESNKCIDTDAIHELEIVATDLNLDDEQYELTVKLDRTPPTINASVATLGWTNADKVNVNIILTDNVSKVKYENRYWNKYGLTKTEADSSGYTWATNQYKSGDNKETNDINKKSYTHTENYSGEGYRKGRIKACDYAGNCAVGSEYIAKIDRTAPKVSVETEKSGWTNTDVAYDYTASDKYGLTSLIGYWNKSGLTEDDANSDGCKWQGSSYENSKCTGNHGNNLIKSVKTSHSGTSYFQAQGVRKIRFIACDQAGNCKKSDESVARLDKTKPNIKTFSISSRSENYKTRTANLSWDINEELSYIGKVETNLKNKSGNNSWNRSSEKMSNWKFSSSSSSYFVVSDKLDGTAVTPSLKACDAAGNCADKTASRYVVTNFSCSVTKSTKACMSSASNGISGQITVKCNAPTDKITVVYTYGNSSKSVCTVNANTTYNLSGSKNKAVFNFRGCDGYYTLKNIKLAAGTSWDSSKSKWTKTPTWETTISSWDSKADDGYSSNCNPDRGTYTDYN